MTPEQHRRLAEALDALHDAVCARLLLDGADVDPAQLQRAVAAVKHDREQERAEQDYEVAQRLERTLAPVRNEIGWANWERRRLGLDHGDIT